MIAIPTLLVLCFRLRMLAIVPLGLVVLGLLHEGLPMKQIMRTKIFGDGESRCRATCGGHAFVSVDSEGGHMVLAALVSLFAMCGWTVCCADCLRPKRDLMHDAPSESWRARVLVRVDGVWATRYRAALRSPRQMRRAVALLEGA